MARETTIARPYAKALFLTAQKENTFKVWSEMLAFAASVAKDEAMQAIIKNPQFSSGQIIQWFQAIGREVFTPEANRFIAQLGRAKRFALLPEIASVFEEMRQAAERAITVVITSAYAINEKERARFEEVLVQRMQAKVRLQNTVDPTMIGGARISVGDWVIDGSVRGKLEKLAQAMGTN